MKDLLLALLWSYFITLWAYLHLLLHLFLHSGFDMTLADLNPIFGSSSFVHDKLININKSETGLYWQNDFHFFLSFCPNYLSLDYCILYSMKYLLCYRTQSAIRPIPTAKVQPKLTSDFSLTERQFSGTTIYQCPKDYLACQLGPPIYVVI